MDNSLVTKGFKQEFHTKYGIIPFGQTYIYEATDHTDPNENGVYKKYVKGTSLLLTLPTVIVDARVGRDGNYDLLTEFTCKQEVGLEVATELRFSSRYSELDEHTLDYMKSQALKYGIDQKIIDGLYVVDHSKCKENDFLQ